MMEGQAATGDDSSNAKGDNFGFRAGGHSSLDGIWGEEQEITLHPIPLSSRRHVTVKIGRDLLIIDTDPVEVNVRVWEI